jgi:hypothetical protein
MIHIFLGRPDPDPLVIDMDTVPDPDPFQNFIDPQNWFPTIGFLAWFRWEVADL